MKTFRLAFLMLLSLNAPRVARAQDQEKRPAKVTIVVADTFRFRHGYDIAILRRPNEVEKDVIVLKKGAHNAGTIARAFDQLAVIRATEGEVPTKAGTYYIDLKSKQPDSRGKRHDERYAAFIDSALATAPKREVRGLGVVVAATATPPSVDVRVP